MSEIKHTPGPWGIFNHNGTICIDNRGGDGMRPCIVDWTGFDTNDMTRRENEANARLIASAPELLEALRKALNYLENTEGEFGIALESADACRAAIRKAEGND